MTARGAGGARRPLVRVALVRERLVAYERQVDGPSSAAAFAMEVLRDRDREAFLVVHLSTKRDVLSAEVVAVGTLDAVLVHPREVFKGAVLAGARSVIVAHNHPSGHTEPSEQDLHVTRQLLAAGEVLGVDVDDHIIVGDGVWRSLRQTTDLWAASGGQEGLPSVLSSAPKRRSSSRKRDRCSPSGKSR